MIGWYLGVLGIIIGLVGSIKFFYSLQGLSGELRDSLLFLIIASIIYVVFSSIMVLLGVFQIQIDESIWQAVPVLYLISTIFFVVGANNFIQPVKSRNPKKPKKK